MARMSLNPKKEFFGRKISIFYQKIRLKSANTGLKICIGWKFLFSAEKVLKPSDGFRNFSKKNSEKFLSRDNLKSGRKREWKLIFHFHSGKNLDGFCWNFEIWEVQKFENLVDLEKPEKWVLQLILDAKNGVDTAENEPSKVWSFSLKKIEFYCIESFN